MSSTTTPRTAAAPEPYTSESARPPADAAAAAGNGAAAPGRQVVVAYLVNQYPATTQTFIRREIQALEAQGVRIERFAVRRWNTPLVDENDRAEQQRTRVILDKGPAGLLLAALGVLFTAPLNFLRALSDAIGLGRRSGKGVLLHLVYLAEACALLGWLRECGAPHVHAHFGTNSTTVALLCRRLGGPPYSFTCHGPEEFDQPRAIGLSEKVRHAAFVVGISHFGCSQLYRWSRFEDWAKVKQVHCGVDALFLEAPPVPPPPRPRLVNVGRVAPSKGQYLLVQAVAKLAAEGTDVELMIVGDGEKRADIQRLIDGHGIGDRVKILGWMSNERVREEILAARALAMPSFGEGLPLVIMEALALRRPVLSTYIAGIPELVEPGECGWLVPAGSLDALTAALREVLATSPAELERMGAAGARRVAQRHDSSKEAGKLAELFRACVPAAAAAAATAPAGAPDAKAKA